MRLPLRARVELENGDRVAGDDVEKEAGKEERVERRGDAIIFSKLF